jgi:hypothetical protein
MTKYQKNQRIERGSAKQVTEANRIGQWIAILPWHMACTCFSQHAPAYSRPCLPRFDQTWGISNPTGIPARFARTRLETYGAGAV